MRWVLWTLAGPTLWAVLFAGVYALHGWGCARGWPAIPSVLGSLHLTVLTATWAAGLLLHAGLLAALPAGPARHERLPRLGASIGLGASVLTLAPILLASSCG